MACNIENMREEVIQLLDDQVFKTSTGKVSKAKNIILKDHIVVVGYQEDSLSKVNNFEAASNQVATIIANIESALIAKGLPVRGFDYYDQINDTVNKNITLRLQVPNKLVRLYELRNRIEAEELDKINALEEFNQQEQNRELQELTFRNVQRGITAEGDSDTNIIDSDGEFYDVDSDTTIVDPYGEIIQQKRNILQDLKIQRKNTIDISKKEILNERIKEIRADINSLVAEEARTFDFAIGKMIKDIAIVEKGIDRVNSQDTLSYFLSLLRNYPEFIENGFYNVIDNLDDDSRQEYIDLKEKVIKLTSKINSKLFNKANTLVNDITGETIILPSGGLKSHIDSSTIATQLLSAKDLSNPFLKTITKLISDALDKLNIAYNSFRDKHRDLVNDLTKFQKRSGLSKDNFYDYMIATDDKGNRTKFLVSERGRKFDKEEEETVGDYRKKLELYSRAYKFKFNESAWNARLKRLEKEFNDKYQDSVTLSDVEIANGKSVEQKLKELFDADIRSIDARTMYNYYVSAKAGNISETGVKFLENYVKRRMLHKEVVGKTSEYIIEMELEDEYVDPKFKEIAAMSSTDPRKKFYEHYRSISNSVYQKTASVDHWLDWSYIPEMTKNTGLFNKVKNIAVNSLTDNVSQKVMRIDPATGELRPAIPQYMTSDLLPVEDRSFDLGVILDKWYLEGTRFDEMTQIENDVNMLLYTLKNAKVIEKDLRGNNIVGPNGEIRYKEDTSNIYKVAKYHVESLMYNQSQATEGVTSIKLGTVEVNKRLKQIREEVDGLKLSEADKRIGLDEVDNDNPYTGSNPKIIKYIDLIKEFNRLSSTLRPITGNKIVNSLISFTAFRFLGLNAFAGFGEMLQAMYSLNLASAGSKWFTGNQALSALKEVMLSSNPGNNPKAVKVRKLSKLFKSVQEEVMGVDVSKNIVSDVAFIAYKGANYMVNNTFLIAQLKNQKVTDLNGVEHTLYDVIDFDNNNNLTLTGNFDPNYFISDTGSPTQNYIELLSSYRSLIQSFRDRRSSTDPVLMQKHWWGRAIGQFKLNWMVNGFMLRFGPEMESTLNNPAGTKGFYRSFFDLFKLPSTVDINGKKIVDYSASSIRRTYVNGIKQFLKFTLLGKALGKKPDVTINPKDIENMRMFVRELSWSLMLLMLITILTAAIKDDDDDNEAFYKYVINQSSRLLRDVTTYMNPTSFMSLTKNPFPMLSTVGDVTSLLYKIVQSPLLMSDNYDMNDLKLDKSFLNLLPVIRQVESTYNKFDSVVQYRY